MIEFRIDRRSGVAAYQQIVHQTRDALLLGHLRVGDQLPTAREVVASTGINPNTVLKAYRELDRDGIVQTRAGAGTFVIATPERVVDAQDSEVGAALGEWLGRARSAGLGRPEVEAMVKVWLDTVFPSPAVSGPAFPGPVSPDPALPGTDVAGSGPRLPDPDFLPADPAAAPPTKGHR